MRSLDEKPYIELWAGEAIEKMSPQEVHGRLQVRIGGLFERLAGDTGVVASEWRFWLRREVPAISLLPDVAYVSNARLALLNADQRREPALAPDIAVEIRSPNDRLSRIDWKLRTYLEYGTILALDIVPEEKSIRIFTRDGVLQLGLRERYQSPLFPWLTFDVAEIFRSIV